MALKQFFATHFDRTVPQRQLYRLLTPTVTRQQSASTTVYAQIKAENSFVNTDPPFKLFKSTWSLPKHN